MNSNYQADEIYAGGNVLSEDEGNLTKMGCLPDDMPAEFTNETKREWSV